MVLCVLQVALPIPVPGGRATLHLLVGASEVCALTCWHMHACNWLWQQLAVDGNLEFMSVLRLVFPSVPPAAARSTRCWMTTA